MKSIFPKKLKSGDAICIIAPASSVSSLKQNTLKIATKRIKDILGLSVHFGKNAYGKDELNSSAVKLRIDDLHDSFRNKNIKGIACVEGGFNSNELLPYIDWNIIKNNPKPIWGYSDATALLNAIYTKTGLVTYNGPAISVMGVKEEKNIAKYIFDYFKKCIMNDVPFNIIQSNYFNEKNSKIQKNFLTNFPSTPEKHYLLLFEPCLADFIQFIDHHELYTPYDRDTLISRCLSFLSENNIFFTEEDFHWHALYRNLTQGAVFYKVSREVSLFHYKKALCSSNVLNELLLEKHIKKILKEVAWI